MLSASQAYVLDMVSNPYKEAMLNPKDGPLVGVPQLHPVDTHRVRVKSSKVYDNTTGSAVWLVNPLAAVCKDGAWGNVASLAGGVVVYEGNDDTLGIDSEIDAAQFTNAPYTKSQFAGSVGYGSSVRARVVGFQVTIQNVSSAQDRNGTFTLYQDPRHHTLQSTSQADAAKQDEAVIVSAADGKACLTYGVVEPAEADGWIWDPAVGYQNSITTGAYNSGQAGDGTELDTTPGYMGIWFKGQSSVSQSFLVETYAIVEYIGELVTSLARDAGPVVDRALVAATHKAVKQAGVHVTHAGADGAEHPHSSTTMLKRLGHRVEEMAESAVSGLATGAVTALTNSPVMGQAAGYITHKAFDAGERVAGSLMSGISNLSSAAVSSGGHFLGFN